MNARRATLAVGALVLPAVASAQQGVGVASSNTPCTPGGVVLRPSLRSATPPAPAAIAAVAAGGGVRDSLRDRRALEVEQMVRVRTPMLGDRIRVARGWMGIRMSELSETRFGVDGRFVRYCDYPVVVSVEPSSPAQRAGIEAGDTIVAYNGIDLRSGAEVALDRLLVPDDTLRVAIRREGQARVLPVVIGKRAEAVARQVWTGTTGPNGQSYGYVLVSPSGERMPGAPITLPPDAPTPPAMSEGVRVRRAPTAVRGSAIATAPSAPVAPLAPLVMTFGLGGPSALAGAQIITLDEDLGAVVGAKTGVLVLRVAERTPADQAGLRAGDVIVLAAGRQVTSPAVLQHALLRNFDERTVPLRVVRKGKAREITLRW